MQLIPYGRQDISEDDIRAVEDVLRSEWLTQGPAVERFERGVAEYCGVNHTLAVCNATAALHLACRALGLGPGDILWTSPNTFVASANCALYCNASIDFVDIDMQSYNMSVASLRDKLESAERNGRLPKVVVPVHFAGQSCQMQEIKKLAERYGFKIIEDAAHAVGGRYLDSAVGNCRYSDITIFSFHPVKIITTGEGGMALTNDTDLATRMRLLRSHGITRESVRLSDSGKQEGTWYYQQMELGYNYRMTDIQAALGASQISRIDMFVEKRRGLATRYDALLAEIPLTLPKQHHDVRSAHHLYVVRIHGGAGERRRVYDGMHKAGIGVNVHYIPVHTQPYYRRLGFQIGDYPNAEQYYSEALSLPLYPALREAEQDRVIQALKSLISR